MAKRSAAKEPSAAHRIAETLRDEILDGRIGAGKALPTVREISIRFEAKGAVIRKALQLLQGEGYAKPGPAGRLYTPALDTHWMYGGDFDRPSPLGVEAVAEGGVGSQGGEEAEVRRGVP